jgi:hypothetical protein
MLLQEYMVTPMLVELQPFCENQVNVLLSFFLNYFILTLPTQYGSARHDHFRKANYVWQRSDNPPIFVLVLPLSVACS